MEDLDGASLDDVSDFFRAYYAPNNAVLSIVGDVDPRQARAWVEQYFGPIPGNPAIPPFTVEPLPLTLGGERRETVEDRVPLPRIYAAFRAPTLGDERLYALEIASQVLAGGKGSRLHRRLVREGRIAQDVTVFLLPFASGPSVFMGWATVRPDATVEAVESGFLEEIAALAREDVSDDELVRAKALIETDELGSLQRVSERADRLGMFATLLDEPDEINRQLERYLAVSAADVRAACADLLVDHNRVILTYVPASGAAVAVAAAADADGGAGGPIDDAEGGAPEEQQ
jgi:predicted Zn-dependent peptidase